MDLTALCNKFLITRRLIRQNKQKLRKKPKTIALSKERQSRSGRNANASSAKSTSKRKSSTNRDCMTLKLNFQTRKETKENGIARWLGSDTQERYNKNLNIFGADWKYADVDISYDLNSQGYRCSEFDQISWEDSVLFFGCSIVLGVGLPINETLPY